MNAGWHTLGVEWRPNGYTFYCDGQKTWETAEALSGAEEFIILSAEVGSWAGDIGKAHRGIGLRIACHQRGTELPKLKRWVRKE